MAGDRVTMPALVRTELSARPEALPLTVVYQDQDLAVIDKLAGMVVHPAPGHPGGTLANALAALFPQTVQAGDAERPGIVHRLDKGTSGLLVVALSPVAHRSLQRQIATREAGRKYLALIQGRLNPPVGTIDAPIGRDPANATRMAVHGKAARSARTSYRLMEEVPGFSLIEATLLTGRTHQIRVHLAAVGHPIAGDVTYGGKSLPGLSRQFLHAYGLVVRSPSTGETLTFNSGLPGDLQTVLEKLRFES